MVRQYRGSWNPEGSCDYGRPGQNGPAVLDGAGTKCDSTHRTGNPSTKELRQKGGMFKASLNYIVRPFSQNSVNLGLEHRGAQAVKCLSHKDWGLG